MARLIAAVTILLALPVPPLAADEARRYAGRPVADVLRELQPDLRIIFSSDLVPSSLRVKEDPKGRDPRQIALEILSPHGLMLQQGPRGTLLVVTSLRKTPPAPRSQPQRHQRAALSEPDAAREFAGESTEAPAAVRIDERVEVSGRLTRSDGDATPHNLEPAAIRETAGGFENVFQVLQLLMLDHIEQIVLHGSIDALTPEEALSAVLPTCGLTFRVEGERLIVGVNRKPDRNPQ